MAYVRLDCIGRNHELFGDVRHAAPSNEQVEDFLLAFGKKIPRRKKTHILGYDASFVRQRRSKGRSLSRVDLITFTESGIAVIPLGKFILINDGDMKIAQKTRA